jgi:hypothetical protein
MNWYWTGYILTRWHHLTGGQTSGNCHWRRHAPGKMSPDSVKMRLIVHDDQLRQACCHQGSCNLDQTGSRCSDKVTNMAKGPCNEKEELMLKESVLDWLYLNNYIGGLTTVYPPRIS